MNDNKWFKVETPIQGIGIVLLVMSGFAATSATGFFIPGMTFHTALVASIILGALGGPLFVHERAHSSTGMLCGVLAAVGGMIVSYYWTETREHVLTIEPPLAWFVGATPGGFLYQMWAERAEEQSATTQRESAPDLTEPDETDRS